MWNRMGKGRHIELSFWSRESPGNPTLMLLPTLQLGWEVLSLLGNDPREITCTFSSKHTSKRGCLCFHIFSKFLVLVNALWNMQPQRFFLPDSHPWSLLKFLWNQQARIINGQTNFTWPGLHQVNSHSQTYHWNFLNLRQSRRKMGQRDLPSHSNNFMHEVTPLLC